ncbi:hypothetical protein CLAFUW4_10734 [Fulvia fulva]|uniref:Major facilitator superfamily (MFS) profile domain-containing protein n=1 Tax=Passalora fulva TaxID=5499 RepID=A0A9Q8LG18_PASFU|nr:uncharacterized protein CLAFUR5_05348 [Fulvia fulva]KAK4615392.1 hypothetical protein CLAFUR4_10739 [Fulvia fulva]KAK4617063.1 hypothetical protein CLAFUR0_10746 [Fulvia fulva]UJO16820.1 hypothetical protein CLAFUR5_05348 [Fulvia fulva]WPV19387.1 hypothetical protein CLAFUW4_10734 [Fulvia fulva]WPV34367.1 hypothetical protein CLAFUW7_10736 [Fulvia fulva]
MSWQRHKNLIAAMSEDRIRVLNIEKFGPGAAANGTLKGNIVEYEHTGLDESNRPEYHDRETNKILRKVDWRLPPVLAVLYLLSFLDRSNIGNAKIAGMTETLNMTGHQFNIALTVFFFPYALFMLPSNMVLKKLKASTWLAILMILWGTVMTMHGVVQTYGQLCAVRTLLGLCESGFTPAAQYLLSCWYARFEFQTRVALFFSAATLAGAFSGILAYAIQKMDGTAGYEGWRWIFILEGIATVAVGACVKFVLPDAPRECTFLTEREKTIIERRIQEDAGTKEGENDHNDKLSFKAIWSIFSDWKIWLWGIIVSGQTISYYAFSFFAPTIVKELGYKSWQAQLLMVPIYLLACIATVIVGLTADRKQTRWVFIVVPYLVAGIAFVALLSIPHPKLPGLTYGFLFLIPLGLSTGIVGVFSWVANNLAPSWRKAMGIAWVCCLANLGGSIGSNIYIQQQAPRYWLGFGFSLGVLAAAVAAAFTLRVGLVRINAKRDQMNVEDIQAMYSEEQLRAMGDASPLYRYVV